jgi:hypothetical protein
MAPSTKLTLDAAALDRSPSLEDDESVWSPARAWASSPRSQSTPPPTPPLAALSEPFLSKDESKELHDRDGDGQVVVEESEADDAENDGPLRFEFRWRRFWRFLGPGFLISLAYLDPGNLEANLQSGAYTGLRLTWVLWWATVLGLVMQETAARLALVTGRDLAQTVRAHYPRWLTHVIYVMMEAAVVAADIQEVVGSSIALLLLSNGWIPLWLGCLITGLGRRLTQPPTHLHATCRAQCTLPHTSTPHAALSAHCHTPPRHMPCSVHTATHLHATCRAQCTLPHTSTPHAVLSAH